MFNNKSNNKKIVIVGGGIGGLFFAVALAQKGFHVSVYETREDIRNIPLFSDRSINQSLSLRGVMALEKLGLWQSFKKMTVVEKGRVFHLLNKKEFFSPYGKTEKEVHFSFNRNGLNRFLLNSALSFKNVTVYFNTKCTSVDMKQKLLHFINTKTSKIFSVKADLIIGADGVNSVVREAIHNNIKGSEVNHVTLDWGYKTFYATSDKIKPLRQDSFHMWPRDKSAMFAIYNRNGSFVFTLMLPLKGTYSFSTLKTPKQITTFFSANFPEILTYIPNFAEDFLKSSVGKLECIFVHPWRYKNFAILLGDAAHAMMPFYSQGVSATFEDGIALSDLLSKYEQERALSEYENIRKKDTDTITRLSRERFLELKDKYRSNYYLARQELEYFLSKNIPGIWTPLYTLISHTNIPYAEAYDLYKKREKTLKMIGFDLIAYIILIKNKLKNYRDFFIFYNTQ